MIWLAQWLSRNREKFGSCRHISDLFPGEPGAFDKNTVEHHPELDCEHASVIKTKQNQPKILSSLDEMWFVISKYKFYLAKNKTISTGWPE